MRKTWYGYKIIAIVLGLSAVSLFLASRLPVWLVAGVRLSSASPCSKLSALKGLRVRERRNEMQKALAQKCLQIKTDPAGFQQIGTPSGMYWIPANNENILPALLSQQATGAYSSGPTQVRPGDIVLDAGAHVGVFTRVALEAGAAMVVAIEPAPENIECLRRNFQSEIASGRVIVYPKGVWDKDALLPMHLNRNSAGDSFVIDLDPGQAVIDLPLTTVDKIAQELRLPRVDFMKLDIKGAERQAIAGAGGVLAKFRPRLAVASEHLPDDNTAIPRAVMAANGAYRIACGICYLGENQIRPEVLHFY